MTIQVQTTRLCPRCEAHPATETGYCAGCDHELHVEFAVEAAALRAGLPLAEAYAARDARRVRAIVENDIYRDEIRSKYS
jgi:predicted amidophosphoribosyltransferase